FVFVYKSHNGFYFGLGPLGDGEHGQTQPRRMALVKLVGLHHRLVSDVSKDRHPFVLGCDGVKTIAVNDEICSLACEIFELPYDFDVREPQGEHGVQIVVMISPHVDQAGAFAFDLTKKNADHASASVTPSTPAGKTPAIDEITVEHKRL